MAEIETIDDITSTDSKYHSYHHKTAEKLHEHILGPLHKRNITGACRVFATQRVTLGDIQNTDMYCELCLQADPREDRAKPLFGKDLKRERGRTAGDGNAVESGDSDTGQFKVRSYISQAALRRHYVDYHKLTCKQCFVDEAAHVAKFGDMQKVKKSNNAVHRFQESQSRKSWVLDKFNNADLLQKHLNSSIHKTLLMNGRFKVSSFLDGMYT